MPSFSVQAQFAVGLNMSGTMWQLTGQIVGAKDRLIELVAVNVCQWQLKGHKPCPHWTVRILYHTDSSSVRTQCHLSCR